MPFPEDVIGARYDALIRRRFRDGQDTGMSGFSRAERMIWLIVTLRCEIDMEGFASVFEQALTRPELEETILYLREVDLPGIADLMRQTLEVLDDHNVYLHGNDPQTTAIVIPGEIEDTLEEIGDQIVDGAALWGVDAALLKILEET